MAESCQGLFSLEVEAQWEGLSNLVTLKTIAMGLEEADLISLMENSKFEEMKTQEEDSWCCSSGFPRHPNVVLSPFFLKCN